MDALYGVATLTAYVRCLLLNSTCTRINVQHTWDTSSPKDYVLRSKWLFVKKSLTGVNGTIVLKIFRIINLGGLCFNKCVLLFNVDYDLDLDGFSFVFVSFVSSVILSLFLFACNINNIQLCHLLTQLYPSELPGTVVWSYFITLNYLLIG